MTTRPDFSVDGSTVYACNEIVSYLKPLLEGGVSDIDKVATVERHIGRFNTPEEVKRWVSKRDGGIRIAALSVLGYEYIGGRIVGNVQFAGYVFTTDQYGFEKDTRCEVIAGRMVKELLGKSAPTTAYAKAENFKAQNLYSDKIDDLGVAIWAVSWTQQWYLDVPLDETTLDDFLTFDLTGEIDENARKIEGEQSLPPYTSEE